jgi:hypothetical protein
MDWGNDYRYRNNGNVPHIHFLLNCRYLTPKSQLRCLDLIQGPVRCRQCNPENLPGNIYQVLLLDYIAGLPIVEQFQYTSLAQNLVTNFLVFYFILNATHTLMKAE